MPREFYNDNETSKSLDVLNGLAKKVDFVLIGGWAVNFYVNMQKSKDVAIAIDTEQLPYFKKYGIQDYGEIGIKYSLIDGTYVGLFIEGVADEDITIPVKKILATTNVIRGIKVVDESILLLLKMGGYFREERDKQRKDVIDVVTLLFYGRVNLRTVKKYVEEYKIDKRKGFGGVLEYIDKAETMWDYITDTKEEYVRLKERYKKEIRKLY